MTRSRDSPGRRGAATSSPLQSAAAGDVKANYEAAGGRNNGGDSRTTTASLKSTATRELGEFSHDRVTAITHLETVIREAHLV